MASGIFTQRQVQREMIGGSWANLKTPAVEYLVVAGGGGGGGYTGAGGGAGGLLQGITSIISGSSITVTVGGAGTGGNAGGTTNGGNGVNSVFGSINAIGGGGGGSWGYNGLSGGSGGGGATNNAGSILIGGQGTLGQGNLGGNSFISTPFPSGGGGGAGTIGLSASSTTVGNGGAGIASSINGTVTAYAGGGGGGQGGNGFAGTQGYGGVGGGGNGGSQYYSTTAVAGTTNTGGGGGGAGIGNGTSVGASGGSGIVIVSYPDVYANAVSQTNGTYSTSGSGSVAFSGTGQYLSTPSNSGFAFGTGDFTFETWFYTNTRASEPGFFQISSTAGGLQTSYTDLTMVIGLSPYPINCIVGSTVISSGTTYISTGTWYHVAITRASGSCRLFINGALVGGPTTVTTNLTGTYAAIGGYYSTGYLLNGNISNMRVVKGTALYTSAFTPLTAPLTQISGTSLLMNTVSGAQFVDTSSNSLILTGTGTPTWNQLSPFTGTGYKNRVYTWTTSGTITF